MQSVFGRTNELFPSKWISLGVPDEGFVEFTPNDLVSAVRELKAPICITSQPALWGGSLRGGDDVLVQSGTLQIEKATSEEHAMDLVQAHMIETLSSVGRETLDFYFLRIRRALEEFQINGALAAMEAAKQEGHIRFMGLRAAGPPLAVLGVWQFHDAFEALWVSKPLTDQEAYQTLAPLAANRRVGVLSSDVTGLGYGLDLADLDFEAATSTIERQSIESPVLVNVRSIRDLELLSTGTQEDSVNQWVEKTSDDSFWGSLANHPSARVRKAVQLRQEEMNS